MSEEEKKIIQGLKERLDDDYDSAWYYQEYIENALNLFGKLELKIDKLERIINMMSEYIVAVNNNRVGKDSIDVSTITDKEKLKYIFSCVVNLQYRNEEMIKEFKNIMENGNE